MLVSIYEQHRFNYGRPVCAGVPCAFSANDAAVIGAMFVGFSGCSSRSRRGCSLTATMYCVS